ncbi:E3 ubiquitin-protein ligase sina, partial [Gryllus bimaculatus]
PEEPDFPTGSSPVLMTTANVISALECPVCFTYMRSPIWLCVNGHNICGRCQQRILTCPVCRGRLLFTRNLALEAISGDLSFKAQESNTSKSDKDETTEQGDSGEVPENRIPPPSADTNAEVCTTTNRLFSRDIEHMYPELATWLGFRPTVSTASHESNTNVEVQNE